MTILPVHVRAYWRIREGILEKVRTHRRRSRRWYRKPVVKPPMSGVF